MSRDSRTRAVSPAVTHITKSDRPQEEQSRLADHVRDRLAHGGGKQAGRRGLIAHVGSSSVVTFRC